MRKTLWSVCGAMLIAALGLLARAAEDEKSEPLFNGKDTTGWKLMDPKATESWIVVSEVAMDPADDKKLVSKASAGDEKGILLRGDKKGSDLYSEKEFGDCKLHAEFLIPKGSNSGVYLMGKYEIQIIDSFGKADDKLGPGDCGGVYHTQAPKTNAMKAPGEWQTYDIIFRAPRFDKDGKKTENAKFINVTLNGTKIQENVDTPNTTGGEVDKTEKATGPIMLQGNHGIVAFRNIKITPMEIK